MRNTLPATCERPTPSDRLYLANAYLPRARQALSSDLTQSQQKGSSVVSFTRQHHGTSNCEHAEQLNQVAHSCGLRMTVKNETQPVRCSAAGMLGDVAHLTMSSEWMSAGVSMTVRLSLRHRGFLHSSFRPHASTAARVAVASLPKARDGITDRSGHGIGRCLDDTWHATCAQRLRDFSTWGTVADPSCHGPFLLTTPVPVCMSCSLRRR